MLAIQSTVVVGIEEVKGLVSEGLMEIEVRCDALSVAVERVKTWVVLVVFEDCASMKTLPCCRGILSSLQFQAT